MQRCVGGESGDVASNAKVAVFALPRTTLSYRSLLALTDPFNRGLLQPSIPTHAISPHPKNIDKFKRHEIFPRKAKVAEDTSGGKKFPRAEFSATCVFRGKISCHLKYLKILG